MIGVFDSGFGGLTVLRELTERLPGHDFLYLGDNARAPYGSRSFDTIYRYTREAVEYLFAEGCPLVILACNTASARALRTIQQRDLPRIAPSNRVLGVLRPVVEVVGNLTSTGHVGILGTHGTIASGSYPMEISKYWPDLTVNTKACPMWVPLVEQGEADSEGADYFVKRDIGALLSQDPSIDLLVLGCTHYPLLMSAIQKAIPSHVKLLNQGTVVAKATEDYLARHPEMDERLIKGGRIDFLTTDTAEHFEQGASHFFGKRVHARTIRLFS